MSLQISLRNVPEEVWLGQWAVRSAVLLATALSFPGVVVPVTTPSLGHR